MATNETKVTPTTELQLNSLIENAVSIGDSEELDRLMAVKIEEKEDEVAEEELPTEDPVDEDGTPVVVGDEATKEEAAPVVEDTAASTPESKGKQPKVDDTESLRNELHRLKSDAGRIPFMQSRMKELERELREVKLSRKASEVSGADPEKAKSVEVPQNLKKKIDDLREVDPALADLLEDLTKSLRSETQETATKVVSSITETEREFDEQRTIHEQYENLLAEVPWAPQAFQSQEWKEWKNQLTPGRRAMAESMYADDVKIALTAFVQDMQARQGNANSVQVPSQAPESNPEAERVKLERERKLASSGSSKTPTAKATQSLDPEAYFKDMYAQIQKDNHIQ